LGDADTPWPPADGVVGEAATSPAGAIVARLLASTVEAVADFELIYQQPVVMRAVGEAARSLSALSEERPEEAELASRDVV
jgi:hypothetical protein